MPRYVVRADRLVDPVYPEPIQNGAVIINGGKIEASGTFEEIEPLISHDTEVHILGQGTLLPGLWNSHVHLTLPGNGMPEEELLARSPGFFALLALENAKKEMRCGVTTVVDVGSPWASIKALKEFIQFDNGSYPTILSSGNPITITGGHSWPIGAEADGVDSVTKVARSIMKEGADLIKVMESGGGTKNANPGLPAFEVSELIAARQAAHWFRKPSFIHAHDTESIRRGVKAGFDVICHCTFRDPVDKGALYGRIPKWKFGQDPKVVEEIVEKGILASPTVQALGSRYEALKERGETRPGHYKTMDALLKGYESLIENCRQLNDAGVRFISGTDTGISYDPFGSYTLAKELIDMNKAGVSPIKAIESATTTPARLFGIASGSIQKDYAADLIYVEGNPLDDLRVLLDIKMVMKDGIIIEQKQKNLKNE